MPFPRNLDFVGRSGDLEALHTALQKREPVGIRPAGLTGMGGIGKTQLAVEYVYQHKADYPGGIFWVNSAEPLDRGLAQLGTKLKPETFDQSTYHQLRVAFEELGRRPGILLIFDNLDDPAQLAQPVGSEGSPLTLSCSILFTTRQRELGQFHVVEVSVLPEGPALQLLLRHPSRHAIRDNLNHTERPEAEAVCRLLGWLPLALELASAFLAEWPDVSLADYRKRLQKEGCLQTLDFEVANLAAVNFQPIHEAAVGATLKTQWDALKQSDEIPRLLLRLAGQFTQAVAISTYTLGLFAGVSGVAEPANPSTLKRALKRLHDIRLVEELFEDRVRLHPLIREFAQALTCKAETREFRHTCATRVAQVFEDFATLEDAIQTTGVDELQRALSIALEFASEPSDDVREVLDTLLRLLRRQAHYFRGWSPNRQPGHFAQQALFRSASLGLSGLVVKARRRLGELSLPAVLLRWWSQFESPELARVISAHSSRVSVAVSGDGRLAVSGSSDGTMAVWDLATGQQLRVLEGHKVWVFSVAVSGDGRLAVSGRRDGTMAVWDLATGQRLSVLEGHVDMVYCVAVSRDGRLAVSGSADRTIAVWDLETGQRLRVLSGHEYEVLSVAVSGDGRLAVSGSADNTMAVWDLETGQRLHSLTGHKDWVKSVAISPDGRLAASGSTDGTVAVWDLKTGQRLHSLTGQKGWMWSVAVSGDGRLAVSGSTDGTVAVWDLTVDQPLHEPNRYDGWVWSVAVSGDGRLLTSSTWYWTSSVAVWDLTTGRQIFKLVGHHREVRSVAMSDDGRLAATASDDRTVAVWDLKTGQRLHSLTGHKAIVWSVAVSGDGRLAVSGSTDGTVAVWDLETGQRLRELIEHKGWVYCVAVSRDGRLAASGSENGNLAVWDLETGQRLHSLTGHKAVVRSVAISPDGRLAASASDDGTVAVWDLTTGRHIHKLAGHNREVRSVAVSGDGRLLASGSSDGVLAVWDLISGQFLTSIILDNPIWSLAWHPKDRTLVIGDTYGIVYCFCVD